MKLLIMSDLHGNLAAMESTLAHLETFDIDACALLGDVIDYGMHSNEVVSLLKKLRYPIICSIRGNHEQAILTESYDRFSSDRGRICARYTRSMISNETVRYIESMDDGMKKFSFGGKVFLAVHGSLEDRFWKSISKDGSLGGYSDYDYVLSGHSHIPHLFEEYYRTDDPEMRNKKKTVFINPGSVGQPRNHNPCAQCAILDTDTGETVFVCSPYDVEGEQKSYNGNVDMFYRDRLKKGI